MAETTFKRLHDHFSLGLGYLLNFNNARLQKIIVIHKLLRVDYLEYNSTTRCSLMVAGSSARCGLALNVPLNAFVSISIHSGKPRDSAAAIAALIRSCALDFSATSITSPGRT